MPKSTLIFIAVLAVIAGLTGYNFFYTPFLKPETASLTDTLLANPTPNPDEVNEVPAPNPDVLLATLSPRQKVAQLLAYPLVVSNTASSSAELLSSWQPGFVTLFGTSISTSSAQQVRSDVTAATGTNIPILLAVDHEGGSVQRLTGAGFTALPSWNQLCRLQPDEFTRQITASAQELQKLDMAVVFGPMVDVASSSSVLKQRVCSDQPALVAGKSQSLISIYNQHGILPVLKHFPGIGQTTKDLHVSFDRVTVTPYEAGVYRTLLDTATAAKMDIGVMVTHVGVVNQFPDKPCSLSADCVGQLSSNYPQALVFSDALNMPSAGYVPGGAPKSLELRATEAVLAGNNVLVFGAGVTPTQFDQLISALEKEYTFNAAFKTKADISLQKIITYKQHRQHL